MANPTTLLTPAARPLPPFPRIALWLVLGAIGVSVILKLIGGVASGYPLGAVTLIAVLGAWWMAAWLEARIFVGLGRRGVAARLAAHAIYPPLVFVGLMLGAAVVGLVLPDAADAFTVPLLFGAIWFASAGAGTLIIVLVDSVVSALVSDFRSRVQLAVLALLALGAALTAVLLRIGESMLTRALESGNLSIDVGEGKLKGEALMALIEAPEARAALFSMLAALAFLLVVPAVISACGKLADTVMERLHPLAAGFRAIGEGRLEVRVEEKGSRDFVELGRSFNSMIEALSLARRMELTFGVYLGRQVTERIRAQHGEAAIEASAREASVFFADVRGFTAMSERLEPSQVLGLLNRYFEQVVAVIDEHEGYLNKFVGDAVVVVFNGPIDQPDHAERAVRCALGLQEAVAALNLAGAFPEVGELEVGVGVATGPVVAGNLGSSRQMEYTVIGDTVNLAARLTSKAPPREVWISEATAAALPERMGREQLEPLVVKGKQAPVTPFRALPRAAPVGESAKAG